MVCSCGYQFIFDPKDSTTKGLTDGKFLAAISKANQGGERVFTENQLYNAYVTKNAGSPTGYYFAAFFLFGVACLVFLASKMAGLFIGGIGLLCLTDAVFYDPGLLNHQSFERAIKSWRNSQREIPGLITEPSLHQPPPQWNESDIYDYGVERILIVQHDLLVDAFVLNGLHSEHRMLVLSESGYPSYLTAMANRLLDQRPDLPVFLFHDADQTGTKMATRVDELDWIDLSGKDVVDLAFTPKDFERIKPARYLNYPSRAHGYPADALLNPQFSDGLVHCFENRQSYDQFLQQKLDTQSGSYG